MIKKPTKLYANFAEFRQKIGYFSDKLKDSSWFPCMECNGECRIIDPTEMPDPVEGHKMSTRIKCPKCSGTGKTTRKVLYAEYAKSVQKWKEELKQYRESMKRLNVLRKKLNKSDMDLIYRFQAPNVVYSYFK